MNMKFYQKNSQGNKKIYLLNNKKNKMKNNTNLPLIIVLNNKMILGYKMHI